MGFVGYTNAIYFTDPHKAYSMTINAFTYNEIVSSWRSTKKIFVVTSSNHLKIFALYETSKECIWLHLSSIAFNSMCNLTSITDIPTTIFKDNTTYIDKLKEDMSRVEQNTFQQSFSTLMCSKRARKLMSNIYVPLIILRIFLPKLCLFQLLKS